MYTIEESKTIIENAGGCAELAKKLNNRLPPNPKPITRQTVEWWAKKGIPAIWQLKYSRYFSYLLKRSDDTSTALTREQIEKSHGEL